MPRLSVHVTVPNQQFLQGVPKPPSLWALRGHCQRSRTRICVASPKMWGPQDMASTPNLTKDAEGVVGFDV